MLANLTLEDEVVPMPGTWWPLIDSCGAKGSREAVHCLRGPLKLGVEMQYYYGFEFLVGVLYALIKLKQWIEIDCRFLIILIV